MRILNLVGPEMGPVLKSHYPEAEIHDEPDGGEYHQIFSLYELSRLPIQDVLGRLEKLAGMLALMGRLFIVENSAEWFARKVEIDGTTDVVSNTAIYGIPERPFRSIYTLLTLRRLIDEVGLSIAEAGEEPYTIVKTLDDKQILGRRLRVVAVKMKEGGKHIWN